MDIPIFNINGEPVGKEPVDSAVWEGRVNKAVLLQAVAMYRANQRQGSASTKTRGHVSGGGKKPWKQKHTGRARAGSIRSPLWRHGGIVFGPHPRDFSYELPKAIRRLALFESLKGKLQDSKLLILDGLFAEVHKTKPFRNLAKVFKI